MSWPKAKFYILLFIVLLIPYGYFFHCIGDWNESTRLDLTYSIAQRHAFNIDPYHKNTGDKAVFQGHYYSDKAPGLSFFSVPVFILTKAVITTLRLSINFDFPDSRIIFYILTFICVGMPSALLGVIFYKFIGYFTGNKGFQLITALGYSLATLAFPYSTLFIGHQFSAVLVFSAFFLAFRLKHSGKDGHKQLFLIGLIAGYAVISEYPTGIILPALFLYIFSFIRQKKDIAFFIFGAIGPFLLLMYYNYACFGNPLVLSYRFETPNPEFEGMKKGFFGITNFNLSRLYEITFGPQRGLYRTSPLLLLCIPGFYYMFKRKEYRPEFYLFLSVTLAFIIMNSSYYAYNGGAAMGPRHIIPILPFMSAGLIFYLERFRESSTAKSIFKILFAVSFFMMLFGTAVDPRLPPVNLEVNTFIFMRLLFGIYSVVPGFLCHSFNLGALVFIYCSHTLFRAPFLITLIPLLIFLIVGVYKLSGSKVNLNKKAQYQAWLILCVALMAINVFLIIFDFHRAGWDFKVSYGAIEAFKNNENPYFVKNLQKYTDTNFPFGWPLAILYFFRVIYFLNNFIGPKLNYYILWLLFLLGAFIIIKKARKDFDPFLLAVLLLTGFMSTYWNFLTGSIGLIELFVFSLVFYYIIKKKYYVAAIFLALSGFVRILPLLFGSLFIFADIPGRSKRNIFLLIISIAAALHMVPFIFFPDMVRAYFLLLMGKISNQYSPAFERGMQNNPSLFCLMQDISEKVFGIYNSAFCFGLYFLSVSFIFFLFFRYARENKHKFLEIFSLGALAFLLVFPRLKPYSFVFALLPIYFLIKDLVLKNKIYMILLVSACPLMFFVNMNVLWYNFFIISYNQYIFLFLFFYIFLTRIKYWNNE